MNYNNLFSEIEKRINSNLDKIIALRNQRMSKEDKSFVTQGDLMVNQIVKGVCDHYFDDYLFVSEEATKHVHNEYEGYIVVIDPIDGTENFTSGFAEWGISISLYNQNQHWASLLACPEMNLWIKTGDTIKKHYSRIRGLSSSLSADEIMEFTKGHEYRILGCCVYNMINVIRGSFLSFENPKGAHSWDILAGLNLALEHNLKVTINDKPYYGQYLQPTGKYKFKVENQ